MADWKVSGRYFEVCNCEAICPCIVWSPPTDGHCLVVLGWQIERGHHGDTDLSGLNAAMVATSPGNMKDGNWRVGLYTDARASQAQAEALGAIFSGQAGGHLSNLGPLIGGVMGARPARIELKADGRRFGFSVDDVMSADYELIEGQGGGDVEVQGHPLAPVPGVAFKAGRSERFRLDDYGLRIDVAQKNAFTTDFAYHP